MATIHNLEVSPFQSGPAYRYLTSEDNIPSTLDACDDPAPIARVKLFDPGSSWTWYIAGYDPETRIAWGLVDGHHIRKILRASQSESAVMTVTFLSALLLDLEFAILLGVGLSLIAYLNRTSRPHLEQRVPDPNLPRRRFNDAKGLAQCGDVGIVGRRLLQRLRLPFAPAASAQHLDR